MNRRLLYIIVVSGVWMFVGVRVAQTNLIGFTQGTISWNNIRHPNASFGWTKGVLDQADLLTPSERLITITVPRNFSRAEVRVLTAQATDQVTMRILAPIGADDQRVTGPAGQPLTAPLAWGKVAVKNRTLTIGLSTTSGTVQVKNISLTYFR